MVENKYIVLKWEFDKGGLVDVEGVGSLTGIVCTLRTKGRALEGGRVPRQTVVLRRKKRE